MKVSAEIEVEINSKEMRLLELLGLTKELRRDPEMMNLARAYFRIAGTSEAVAELLSKISGNLEV